MRTITGSIFHYILLALAATIFVGCSPSGQEKISGSIGDSVKVTDSLQSFGTTAAAEAKEPQFQVDETFQQQLAGVLTSYLALKDAFIASDSTKVPANSLLVSDALKKVDVALLTGDAQNAGKKYLPSLEKSLRHIHANRNIEKQRAAFRTLSDSLYITIKAFGLGGKEAFYEYCPMAFNEEGAFWLSDQETIRNPYFGDKMLTCGEVKEKLK